MVLHQDSEVWVRDDYLVPTPTPEPTPRPPTAPLVIESWRCYTDTSIGFAYFEGEVTNNTNSTVEHIEAVGNWYAGEDTFVTSDTALIQFDPLLPGQTSPFKIISSWNPAMSKCRLQFKEFFGGTIRSEER